MSGQKSRLHFLVRTVASGSFSETNRTGIQVVQFFLLLCISHVSLVLLLVTVSITLASSQSTEIFDKGLHVTEAPIKLDKNLRRALLKALTDLEAESAEQHRDELETIVQRDTNEFEGVAKKNLNDDLGVQKTTFSFKSFPSDDDIPSEDKLQNSNSVEAVRYVTLKTPVMNIEKATQEDARSFHVQNVVLPVKKPMIFGAKTESRPEQREKTTQATMNTFSVNRVESLTLKPMVEISESLTGSASNGIAAANALVAPKPTEVTPITSPASNATVTDSNESKVKTEEVKIFQAPLVAAFTVQQDEQGVPKSVVPIFRSPNDGQALTLQEQLEFKQQLLEKQLAELHHQQIQQTQFLLEEQAKLKQLEEQARIKQFEEQRLRFQPQRPVPQKQFFFEPSNNLLTFQPPVESNVHLQPSLTLEVPNFKPQTKPPTPARQIQHLLYQSGIAEDLSSVQGIGNPEDVNIVSKVLALNVGALPNNNQFTTSAGKTSARARNERMASDLQSIVEVFAG
ncbi:hypothetical protein WN51_01999 [Melipona quadrifasciata]|uniref:Uncharacterized protein n=1 Tax=Melipona quadrifasciata TaxID=166423 RepID=A0A0N0BKK6_9HYME|nr:hypothetical protein WN51_01999 [Melipona quadrifasciata]